MDKEEVAHEMRRILMVLSVAALMAVMLVAMAVPAFAVGPGTGAAKSSCVKAERPPTGSPQHCR